MGFVKVQKNKAYYKRFQVKYRRRREARTDYYARKRLVSQDKNKYASPKYRFVVRISNRDITCQIFAADLDHDVCIGAAYSHELRRYGLKVGFTNYAAAYATGLLLARRINKKFGLDELYAGKTEVDGEDFNVREEADPEGKAPFKALLDVGLARTTTGARIFGALKGALDGGIDIPHSDRRFPGSADSEDTKAAEKYAPNPERHRDYIFGKHVGQYMTTLKDAGDDEAYTKQFKRYIDAGITGENVEKLWAGVHKAIRADPSKARDGKERGSYASRKTAKTAGFEYPAKFFKRQKLAVEQRKSRVRQRLAVIHKKNALAAAAHKGKASAAAADED